MSINDITLDVDDAAISRLTNCINRCEGPVVLRKADGRTMGKVTRSQDGRNLLVEGSGLKSKGGIYIVLDAVTGTRDLGALVLGLLFFGEVYPVSALGPKGMLFSPAEDGQPLGFVAPPDGDDT